MTVTTEQVTMGAKLFGHPLRVEIARRLLVDGKSSPSGLAEQLGQPLGNVSYHVRQLAAAGVIRQAGTRPRRGAVEHFYVANGEAAAAVKALRAATGELLAAAEIGGGS
jgi:DNA-binding transcriptional ArsR family regulator